MKQEGQFLLFTREEFKNWLFKNKFSRVITQIQNHHTYIPDYRNFTGDNHFALLKSMRGYHISTGMSDIAQNLTTFPDGLIAVCRNFEKDPAGIKGANAGALCIENLGNFDVDGDIMTDEHRKTILFLNAVLCQRFKLQPSTDTILYHHWFDLTTGARTNGKGAVKTCPGTNFFGGNSIENAKQNFIPLVKALTDGVGLQEAVDILRSKGVIHSPDYWLENAVGGRTVRGDYMVFVILNFIAMFKTVDDYRQAIGVLAEMGIIKSPEYWIQNAVKGGMVNGEYAGKVLVAMANKLKG